MPTAICDDEDLAAKWYAHVSRKYLPPLTTLSFPVVRAFMAFVQEDRKV